VIAPATMFDPGLTVLLDAFGLANTFGELAAPLGGQSLCGGFDGSSDGEPGP
jgi:hypothetical protein